MSTALPQVTPLLADLRSGNLVGNLEALTRSAADAAADIHQLQNEVPPPLHPDLLGAPVSSADGVHAWDAAPGLRAYSVAQGFRA